MKSLVEIAKDLGIRPNPDMMESEYFGIAKKIGKAVAEIPTGLSLDDKHEQERRLYPYDLGMVVYNTHKFMARHWNETALKKVVESIKKTTRKDIWVHSQRIGTPLSETSFIHHASSKIKSSYQERFVADIDLTSPKFEKMVKQLDDFITKYPADFKIPNFREANRTDTMDVYMTQSITPEMAQEFYRIVKPCLNEMNHDKLDGFEIFEAGKPIKGIKIGPEISKDKEEQSKRKQKASRLIFRDMPKGLCEYALDETGGITGDTSLGEKAATLQVLDLIYYLIGKEGKSPFRLETYDGKTYDKRIDFPKMVEQEKIKTGNSIWKKITSFLHKDKKRIYNPDKDFEDPKLWSDVKVQGEKGVYYGHRINITSFTAEERKSLKEMLTKHHIQYAERQATTNSVGICPGDWTIRVIDPSSVRQLRSIVFRWADGPHVRPLFKTKAEYDAEQKMMQEKRSVPVSLDEKPKWAEQCYWDKVCGTEKGYVMDLGTSDRYNDLGQPEGVPFNEEITIKELAKRDIQAEKCVSGFGNYLPSYKITHNSLVILGKKNVDRFEQIYLKEEQVSSRRTTKAQGGER